VENYFLLTICKPQLYAYFCSVKISGKYWILLLILSLIWGSSFILMKKGMYASSGEMIFNSNQVATMRILLSSLVLLPFGIRAFKRVCLKKHFVPFIVVALCGNLFPAFLFTYAETGISSGFTGMLNSITPIFVIFIGFGFFKIRMTYSQILGSIIGSLGVISLLYFGKSVSLDGDWEHIFAVVLATLCYAISLSVIRYKLSSYKSIDIAAIAFLLLLPPSLTIFMTEHTWSVFESKENAWNSFIAISILGIIGTAFALFLFNNIIKNTSALFASSVTYFIPIVAVFIGFFFGERISAYQIISMLMVLLGVFVANSKRDKKVFD